MWMLVLFVFLGGSAVDVQQVNFTTQMSCEAALNKLKRMPDARPRKQPIYYVDGVCVHERIPR